MRSTLLAVSVAVIMMLPAMAFAGGGAKATSTIKVKNMAPALILAVIVDPPAGFPANPTQAQLTAAGGKLLNAAEVGSFLVKAGTHTLAGAFVDPTTGAVGVQGASQAVVASSKTATFFATGTTAAAPIFTLQP